MTGAFRRWPVGADTLVALLAGIEIFPIVSSNGLDPAAGPRLIFVTLPVAFGNMPGGYLIGVLFFVMLFFAAFSTVIAMLEPAVSWLEEHKGMSRPLSLAQYLSKACWACRSWTF